MLIKYIKKKKNKGMEMLVDEYGGFITAVVRKYLGTLKNYEEECIDDVLLAIWENIDSYDKNKSTLKNWIGSIAKYKALNYKKKYIKEMDNCEIEVNNAVYIDNNLRKLELEQEVENLLRNLNERDKKIFKQYYLEDISLETIAIEDNTTVENLYNRISRGRKKLRELYKG